LLKPNIRSADQRRRIRSSRSPRSTDAARLLLLGA
jgi:hypothetical protein